MKRFCILAMLLMGIYTLSFGQGKNETTVLDTVYVSGRGYKVCIDSNRGISYENINDTLRFLPDNVDGRYLGYSYPVYPGKYIYKKVYDVFGPKFTKQICNEIGNFCLILSLYVDKEGHVKEATFYMNEKLRPYFSVENFDKLMMSLLQSQIYVGETPAFDNARWIRCLVLVNNTTWLSLCSKYGTEIK